MRNMYRNLVGFSSLRQLPVRGALYAHISTLPANFILMMIVRSGRVVNGVGAADGDGGLKPPSPSAALGHLSVDLLQRGF